MQAQGAPPGEYTVSFYLDDEDQVGSGSFTTDGNGNWGPGEVATWDTTNRGDDTYNFYAKYIRLGVDPPPANEDGSYTVTIANTYPAWEPPDINGNGIQWSGITAPSDHVFYASSPSSFEVACSCAQATDSDHRYAPSGSPHDTYPSDTLTYTWSAGTLGSWKNGINTGRNVTWVCPANYAGEVLISCGASDAANTAGENGSRDDIPNGGGSVHVDVVKINLDVSGVSEANEEDPGAFPHFNVDNDNGNVTGGGVPIADYTEDGPVTGENDTVGMGIGLTPSTLTLGSVVLSRSDSKPKVWSDAEKGSGNAVLVSGDSKTWDLSDQAQRNNFNGVKSNLRLEGCDDGSSTLTATVKDPNGQEMYSDTVKATFIAALCGDQPTPSQRSDFEDSFPNLVHCEWSITMSPSEYYNCIAWSIGNGTKWFNKVIYAQGQYWDEYWSGGVHFVSIDKYYGGGANHDVYELDDLDAFYLAEAGYAPTASGPSDAKVMYYDGFHAAKKRECNCGAGQWIMYESKCGTGEAIEHRHDGLDGSTIGYGVRERYYK